MTSDLILSFELLQIVKSLDEGRPIRDRLIACADLARVQEEEIAVHRLGEASLTAKKTMESEAGKVLATGIIETNNNVVRPNFNKGKTE